MQRSVVVLSACLLVVAGGKVAHAGNCGKKQEPIGVSRTQIVDTTDAPLFGTFQYSENLNLQFGEVVLTFDDGPHPQLTDKILKALNDQCTKATFFPVGMMAKAYPEVVRRIAEQGHTIGAHTYRHANLQRTSFVEAKKQIETSFAVISRAAGMPIAPFFRYPGLRDSRKVNAYLAERDIAIFSVDVISGDTSYSRQSTILRNTLNRLKRKGKGILLFHDLKKATARLVPTLLKELKARGYKIVHLVPKRSLRFDAPVVARSLENPVSSVVQSRLARFLTSAQIATSPVQAGAKNAKKSDQTEFVPAQRYRSKRRHRSQGNSLFDWSFWANL